MTQGTWNVVSTRMTCGSTACTARRRGSPPPTAPQWGGSTPTLSPSYPRAIAHPGQGHGAAEVIEDALREKGETSFDGHRDRQPRTGGTPRGAHRDGDTELLRVRNAGRGLGGG